MIDDELLDEEAGEEKPADAAPEGTEDEEDLFKTDEAEDELDGFKIEGEDEEEGAL